MAASGPPPEGEQPIPRREDTQPIPIPPPPGGRPPVGGEAAPAGEAPPGSGAPPAGGRPTWESPAAGPPRRPATRVAAVAGALVALVLVALVAVNAVVAGNAESRAAEEASAALGAPADVRLQGFPVGLRILLGSPVDATLVARDVPMEGSAALLTTLEVQASDVVIERRGDGAIRAEHATFLAEIDEAAVRQMLGVLGRIPLTEIELANGVARLSVAGFALLDATADIEGGEVVFRVAAPIGNLADVRLELDDLPLGFRADGVEIRPGVLRLRGSATDLRVEGQPQATG